MKEVKLLINRYRKELIQLRHDIHAYPEPAFEEFETAKKVCNTLQRIPGIEIESGIAETGVVATLGREKKGPCVALRADMDCLPITEATGAAYTSTRPGLMHACGHDGHTTCLIGAALVLGELQDNLQGPVKFIFQPAEESGGGARKMVEAGVLSNPEVDAIFGLHGWPELKVGEITSAPGPVMAGDDRFTITIKGVGAHAAAPHTGVDPIVIAAQIVNSLQTIVSRSLDPLKNLVLTIGKIQAGTASNIIPTSAELVGTIRCFDSAVRSMAVTKLQLIAEQTARAFGARATVQIEEGYPSVVNDERAYEFFSSVAEKSGLKTITGLFPVMGSEDFSYYAQKVPGMYWALGVCPENCDSYPALHNPGYDFTDQAIDAGVMLHAITALKFASEWAAREVAAA